jgi:hypothetical protein
MPQSSQPGFREFLASTNRALAEVAAVTQMGLAINDPQQSLHLRIYLGGSTVSALQVACILYAGVQLLLPGEDARMDLGREYSLAKGLVGGVGQDGRAGWGGVGNGKYASCA